MNEDAEITDAERADHWRNVAKTLEARNAKALTLHKPVPVHADGGGIEREICERCHTTAPCETRAALVVLDD